MDVYRSDLIFLHPKASTEIQDDAIFEGTVVLYLPSARKVKRLDMELVRTFSSQTGCSFLGARMTELSFRIVQIQIGRQNMYLMGKYEQYE